MQKTFIFTDVRNKIIVSTQDLRNFHSVQVPFTPTKISFHPDRENTVLGYGLDGSFVESLYHSNDYGQTWSVLRSNVAKFQW